MKKWMIVPVMAAALAVAAPAFALNKDAYKAGTAPAAGTAEQAEVCATTGVLLMLALGDDNGNPTAENKDLYEMAKTLAAFWVSKASQFRNITTDQYLDTVVLENVTGVIDAPTDVHTNHFIACMQATPAS